MQMKHAKNMFLAAALSIVGLQPAFANEEVLPMDSQDQQALTLDQQDGLSYADSELFTTDADFMRPPRRPGRPGGPGRPPGWPGGPGRQVECLAQNARGQVFSAWGRNPSNVQQRAMNQCYQYSRRCRPLGCR